MDFKHLIDNGEKEIYPGAVYNIRGSRAKSLIKENLSRAIKGDDKSLGKEVFYLGGEWEVVSESLYQTSGELEIIRSISSNIASEIPVGSVIVELGPSNFVKTRDLLDAIDIQKKQIIYLAVDIDRILLRRYIPVLNRRYNNINCISLCGTFDQALGQALDQFKQKPHQNLYLWSFGSSLSNAKPDKVVRDLRGWASVACSLLIGQDGTVDKNEIERHYHTEAFLNFFRSGLQTADRIMGETIFTNDKWKLGCTIGSLPTSHTFIMTADEDINDHIKEDAQLDAFPSFKYTKDGMQKLASEAECTVAKAYAASCAESRIFHILPNKDSKVEQGDPGICY